MARIQLSYVFFTNKVYCFLRSLIVLKQMKSTDNSENFIFSRYFLGIVYYIAYTRV